MEELKWKIESQSLGGQKVDMRGFRILPSVKRQVVVSAVVSQNNQKIREALAVADKARTSRSENKIVGFIPEEVIMRSKRLSLTFVRG